MNHAAFEGTVNPSLFKTFAASTAVLLAGLTLLLHATEQGSAFTTEALRRSQVERAPQALPDFALLDANSARHSLHGWLLSRNKVWVVNFIYTRCLTVCSTQGAVYQQLQAELEEQAATNASHGGVGLLSISFDPQHDNAAALKDYAQRMRINPATWQVLTLRNASDRQRLLDAFGILVLPAPLGEFEHNAAFHVVNAKAQLVHIVDMATPSLALEAALRESTQ
jgi:protein SCO1